MRRSNEGSALVCIGFLLIICILLYYYSILNNQEETQFNIDKKELLNSSNNLTEDNIYYIKDNFSSYGEYSLLIDRFDDTSNLSLSGSAENLKLSDVKYGEEKTVSFTVLPNTNNRLVIRKDIKNPINLSRWNDSGYFTSWIKLENRTGILGISLKLGDSNGNYRLFNELPNLQIDAPVLIKVAGPYPDLYFPNKNEGVSVWQNFRLVNNDWNYVFWRGDKDYFNDTGSVDFRRIAWFELNINLSNNVSKQVINIADLRVQDGLQKTLNPTDGNWYAPNGAPQYGIFDVDETSKGSKDFKIRLLNVRQNQYPSNGDHVRILSKKSMPLNFTMQIYFKLIDLPEKWKGDIFNYTSLRKNTYFRVQYDFDNKYDPGHDWFGAFISLEYDKFGLVTTYPIVRYFKQGQEPIKFTGNSRVSFSAKDDVRYILDIKVIGQHESAIIYEANKNSVKKVGNVEYTFSRQRYGVDKRYPLSIEATGNVHAEIYSVEVISLDNVSK